MAEMFGSDFFDTSDSYWDSAYENLFTDTGWGGMATTQSYFIDSMTSDDWADRVQQIARIDMPFSSSEDASAGAGMFDWAADKAGSALDWLVNSKSGAGLLAGMAQGGLQYMTASENADMLAASNKDELAYKYAAMAQNAEDAAAARALQEKAIGVQEEANAIRAAALAEEKRKLRAHNDSINKGPGGNSVNTFKFNKG